MRLFGYPYNDLVICKDSPDYLPLIKKPGLDSEVLKNYRPVSNLSFLSKIIEKVISTQLVTYIVDNGLTDDFRSAYKCGHSTETALLRVYNDIVVTIGKGNGNFLVLLDLSSAFDTIDRYTRTKIYFSSYFLAGKKMTSRDDVQKSYLSGRWRDIMTTCFVAFLSKIYL